MVIHGGFLGFSCVLGDELVMWVCLVDAFLVKQAYMVTVLCSTYSVLPSYDVTCSD
jgi:hypothetical protein